MTPRGSQSPHPNPTPWHAESEGGRLAVSPGCLGVCHDSCSFPLGGFRLGSAGGARGMPNRRSDPPAPPSPDGTLTVKRPRGGQDRCGQEGRHRHGRCPPAASNTDQAPLARSGGAGRGFCGLQGVRVCPTVPPMLQLCFKAEHEPGPCGSSAPRVETLSDDPATCEAKGFSLKGGAAAWTRVADGPQSAKAPPQASHSGDGPA